MLNTSQQQTLKAYIQTDPVLSTIVNNEDGAAAIATIINTIATPDFIVWKTSVSTSEIMNNGFVWSTVDGMTNGKARIWEWMSSLGTINPSKANIRQGLADAFGAATAMANSIAPHLKRPATVLEKIFATGGVGTTASPSTLVVDGQISYQEVYLALNS